MQGIVTMYPLAKRHPDAVPFLGIPLHPLDADAILDFMGQCRRDGTQAMVLNINVNAVNLAFRFPWMKQMLCDAPLVFCDGDGIRLGCRFLGLREPPKVTYRVFLWQVAAWCEETGASLYLLGGAPGVAERAGANLQARHPGLRLAGAHDGFFEKSGSGNDRMIEEINRTQPDVLVVCFGMPLQERWLLDNGPRLATQVFLTGGAALDYVAGVVSAAPPFLLNHSMEWIYRLYLEPRRMFSRYFFGNALYLLRLVVARLKPQN